MRRPRTWWVYSVWPSVILLSLAIWTAIGFVAWHFIVKPR